jgi:predicted dienelactone hydrolase
VFDMRLSGHNVSRVLSALVIALLAGGVAACSSDAASTSTAAPIAVENSAVAPTTEPVAAATTAATTSTAASSPAAVATTTTAAPVGVDLLSLAKPGPFGVGRSTVTVNDATRGRSLLVDVWYPVAPDATGTAARYAFSDALYSDSKRAIADAPIAQSEPYALIVYSHGSGGLRYISSFMTEQLASYGFVVAAPDHIGNTAVERITNSSAPFEQIQLDRPADITAVIDQMLSPTDASMQQFAGVIDADRIGVVGHSFGGYTALAMASGHTNTLGSVGNDPRVGAIVALAPASTMLSDEELASITIPTMLIVGSDDTTTPLDPETTRPFSLVSSTDKYKVVLDKAAHQSFTDICDYGAQLRSLNAPQVILDTVDSQAAEGCPTNFMPIERAHELTNAYTLSFFLNFVAGTPELAGTIDPALVPSPDDVDVALK